MNLQKLKEFLRKHKKSFTPERQDVFNCAKKMHHFSAEELFSILKKKGSVSRMSVFRTVQLFEEVGVFRKVITNSNAVRYEVNSSKDHHEHMQCLNCGKLIEFPDTDLHKQLEEIAQKHDFIIQEHSIFLRGVCNKCSE